MGFIKIGSCNDDSFIMTKRAIKFANRRKEVLAYKKEKEEEAKKEKIKDYVCVLMFGEKKEVSKDEYDNVYRTLGFKIID